MRVAELLFYVKRQLGTQQKAVFFHIVNLSVDNLEGSTTPIPVQEFMIICSVVILQFDIDIGFFLCFLK